MATDRLIGGLLLLAPLAMATSALGHSDDPKETVEVVPYVGPGYRADVDGPTQGGGFNSENVQMHAWLTLGELNEPSSANDIWGYVSGSAREYALVGLQVRGTAVVEVTNPGNPQLIEVIDGNDSTWRDIRVYGEYAYVVTEADGGVQVLDLSDVDNGNVSLVNTINTGGSGNTHNVSINTDSGFLYRCGGSGNGLRIYDLNANPVNPPFVASWADRYVHDAQIVSFTSGPYAGREIAFCCSGFSNGWVETGLDIVDVTNKGNLQNRDRLVYQNGVYSHQGWLSADGQFFYLGDELDESTNGIFTTTFVLNVSNIDDISFATTFTNGKRGTNHNMFTVGNVLYQSNYTNGLRVFDACDPMAVEEIGYFDTYPESDEDDYLGNWGNYPFLPSGLVLVSDRSRGLFVLEPQLAVSTDLNGDGETGFGDLLILLASWGPCTGCCAADFDGNGEVAFADLLTLLAAWTG